MLFLRRIRPDEVLRNLQAGNYTTTRLTGTGVVAATVHKPVIESNLSIKTLVDRSGTTMEFVISHPKSDKEVKYCKYCELPFKKGYGTPISVSVTKNAQGERLKTYTVMDECYNSLECMKTDFLRSCSYMSDTNDRHFTGVGGECLVRQMIYDLVGEKDIRDAYPPSLLVTKSGSMTPEEYLKGTHTFTRVPNVAFHVGSSEYHKITKA